MSKNIKQLLITKYPVDSSYFCVSHRTFSYGSSQKKPLDSSVHFQVQQQITIQTGIHVGEMKVNDVVQDRYTEVDTKEITLLKGMYTQIQITTG